MEETIQRLSELAQLVTRHSEEGPSQTAIANLATYRASTTSIPLAAMDDPSWSLPALVVVVQGRNRAVIGTQSTGFKAGTFMVTAVDLPMVNAVFETDADLPFLGVRLRMDPALINELLLTMPAQADLSGAALRRAPARLCDALTDGLVRLVRLLDDPIDAMILAPQVEREISYRLLRGSQGGLLRQLVNAGSRVSQIRLAIEWFRHHYAERFCIENVASIARMSPSSFYQHFKAVTSLTPLQYRKRLRLAEARRLIWTEHLDAATAGFRVGYESASQFSREYKRVFGDPPGRDIATAQAGGEGGGPSASVAASWSFDMTPPDCSAQTAGLDGVLAANSFVATASRASARHVGGG